jgi:putative phosphonate metabolism protein
MRYALYYTPPPGSALDRFGAAAIGYDAATGEDVAPLALDGIDPARLREATADPRTYGFHATLKAPFRLRSGRTAEELAAALEAFAATTPPVALGRLVPAALGRFLALVPAEPSTALQLLAAECVAAFDGFRAPLTPEDRAKRLKSPLGPRRTALLDRWGYPHVFEAFRFHMTLTGQLADADERARWLAAVEQAFAPLAAETVTLDAVSLLAQEGPGSRFRLLRRFSLTGEPA